MSDSRHEATRARGQNAEEGFLSLPAPPQFVESQLEDAADALLCPERLPAHPIQKRKGHGSDYADAAGSDHSDGQLPSSRDPRASRSHGDRRDAVSSVGRGEWQERRTRSGGYRRHKVHKRHRRHRMRGHSCQLGANQKLGAHREREARHEETDQRASFPGCEFEHGEAAAGSGHAGSSGAEVLCGRAGLAPPSSPCSVPEPSQDVQDAPRRPELAADCQRCHKRPCRWAAWEEQELGPSCSYPHLGPYEWSCGRSGPTSPCQLAAGCQMCHGSPCHWPVWVKLELWPSRSFYPDLGPCEWSWGGRGSTCRCPEHCPTCCPAHRF
ncbi:uncharacterized protein ACOB8E_020360 [Sarcophilus harrisii]